VSRADAGHIRIHHIDLDVHAFEGADGKDYTARITINEAKLFDLVERAIKRHDNRAVTANGLVVCNVKPAKDRKRGTDQP
jgi:hypothetical protein